MSSALPEHSIKAWDGSAIKASLWLRDVSEHAAKHGYLTLLLHNYYVSRNTLIVASNDKSLA